MKIKISSLSPRHAAITIDLNKILAVSEKVNDKFCIYLENNNCWTIPGSHYNDVMDAWLGE